MLVALIGHQWASLVDEQGRRRFDDPDDYVRFEVQAALERGVRVIPVLVDGARPLRQEQLPAELRNLARLNALKLSYGRYEYDADRLFNVIQQVFAAASSAGIVPESGPAVTVEAPAVPRDVWPDGDGNVPSQAAQKDNEVVRKDRTRTTRVLIEARRTSESIVDEPSKAHALARIAGVLAATDPDRAAGLIADAERIAQSISVESSKDYALANVAKALAATDPSRCPHGDLIAQAFRASARDQVK